ncbi:MAG TPA: type II secretion system F family protein [Gammaproteobacteria bacterium]|nr:type II secretion system F family protein [Gammaproteobacteria bacterium]
MALFHYQGRNPRGDLVEGNVEASSADVVAGQLFNSGVTPIDIIPARAQQDVLALLRTQLANRRPNLSDLILFSHQMHTLTKAGVPITQALSGLAESTRNPVMGRALQDVTHNLESGRDLSSSLARHPQIFPSLVISLVQVGENTGRLDEVFLQISKYLELEKDTRDRIKAALRYPIIVLTAIAVAITIINMFVIPNFAKIFKSFHVDLPLATRILIGISNFFVTFWPYLLVGLALLIVGARAYVKTEQGRYRWDKFKLRIPLIGNIIRRSILARYARSFAMTSRTGVPLVQGLTIVAKAIDNDYIAERILSMRNGIERGESLTRTATLSGMFTPLVLQMISVGEDTGAVDTLLLEVAEFYEREVDYDIKSLSAAIEPILMVAIGIMVLILALGIFLPMWELARAARGSS